MKRPFKAHFRPVYFLIRKLFSKELSLLELAYSKTSYYSQFGEDVFLERYFSNKTTGFYVDVGAFHPFNISNTFVFHKRGWRGINIEPNPSSFRAFERHRPRDINLNIAVSEAQADVAFNCSEECSGIDDNSYLFRDKRKHLARCLIRSMPLSAVLAKHLPAATTIDFMSVDCEGHDAAVLKSNDWSKFRPSVVLVEDHEPCASPIDNFMTTRGYTSECRLGLTKVFTECASIAPIAK